MSEHSKIQWTDDTHNFWRGCTKVSPGCKNCYAEQLVTNRLGGEWGKGAPRIRAKDFDAPLRWNKHPLVCDCGTVKYGAEDTWSSPCPKCKGSVHRRRVFSLSLGDWLDDEVPIEWLADMIGIINDSPNLDFLLLTKRPQNWKARITAALATARSAMDMELRWLRGEPPHNIWLGVSVENQETADERIPKLLEIPAKVRFVSYEPALDYVSFLNVANIGNCLGDDIISWIIVGGESGPNARPFNVAWARSTIQQCKAAGVACFVKQMGADPRMNAQGKVFGDENWPLKPTAVTIRNAPLHPPLKDRKGGDVTEWPDDLCVREWPKVTR